MPILRLDDVINNELQCAGGNADTETNHVTVETTTRSKCLQLSSSTGDKPFCCWTLKCNIFERLASKFATEALLIGIVT